MLLLRGGVRRFGELRRLAPGISQRMLTLTLRNLERDGLITRTHHATAVQRVDYGLTALGDSLATPLEALGAWALAHENDIASARLAFDGRERSTTGTSV